jgi:hypothetical protein
VTIASTIAGMAAGIFYLKGTPGAVLVAGLLVTLKDVLDSADGQLARAKNMYSRVGRFLDSIGDFVVDLAVFGAIGWMLFSRTGEPSYLVLSFAGLLGISLRVSYHVFYQTNFLHLERTYGNNRITEEVRPEDLRSDRLTLVLQRTFQAIYGWQDRLMVRVDEWSRRRSPLDQRSAAVWFADPLALRISGFLGFGTELFILMLCSVFDRLDLYLFLNLMLMNGIWVFCILYRRVILRRKLAG